MSFLFKARDGQTPMPPDMKKGLKQKHIQTIGELDEYEEENISEGISWSISQDKNSLDYNFWMQLHKKLFGNVWSWAGKIRTHDLQNSSFLPPSEIWGALRKIEEDTGFWLANETYPKKEIVARFHERMLTIHPFTNGNGRFSRILAEYFCKQNKIDTPTWGDRFKKDPKVRRDTYIAAIEEARNNHNFSHLLEFVFDK